LDDLLKRVHGRGVGQTLVLVDACRNEPLRKGAKAGRKGIETVVFEMPQQAALFLSCSQGEFSYELENVGPKGGGVFFHYVIDGLNGKAADPEDGTITWDGLTNYVKRRVTKQVATDLGKDGGRQTPASIGHLEGVIELARVTAPTVPAPPSTPTPTRRCCGETVGVAVRRVDGEGGSTGVGEESGEGGGGKERARDGTGGDPSGDVYDGEPCGREGPIG